MLAALRDDHAQARAVAGLVDHGRHGQRHDHGAVHHAARRHRLQLPPSDRAGARDQVLLGHAGRRVLDLLRPVPCRQAPHRMSQAGGVLVVTVIDMRWVFCAQCPAGSHHRMSQAGGMLVVTLKLAGAGSSAPRACRRATPHVTGWGHACGHTEIGRRWVFCTQGPAGGPHRMSQAGGMLVVTTEIGRRWVFCTQGPAGGPHRMCCGSSAPRARCGWPSSKPMS